MSNESEFYGVDRYSAYDVLPLGMARDVMILPATDVTKSVPNGGPILKDPDLARVARHQRGGLSVGQVRSDAPELCPRLDESVLWGGYAVPQITAMATEFTARILPALQQRSEDRVAFVMPPDVTPDDLPDAFWEMMAWYGLTPERVLLISEPVIVSELWVAPQAEQSTILGPSYHYLELLARNTTERDLVPSHASVTYVPRAPLTTEGGTLFLGETYLAECLGTLGVRILEPFNMPLTDTLSGYAGSETLIFGEGPPSRLRQLLGYYEQDIAILARENGAREALNSLLPRARRVSYGDVTRGVVALVRANGQAELSQGLSVFDPDALFGFYEAFGVPLRDTWNQEAFEAVCSEELQFWLKRQFNQVRQSNAAYDWDKSIARVRADLGRFGVTYARAEAQFWLQRRLPAE